MPNKKINQLDLRTAVGTDLMLVGDPTNGTAFKSTLNNLPLVPTSRVLTINGVPFDLSQNRSWTIDLSGYVPYIGANTNVNLGEHQLLAGQVTFDQSPTGAAGVGVMRWNNTDGTLDLGLKGGNVTLQVGQEQVVRVVNKSGLALNEAAYQVVKITDAQGQRLAVDLAQGNNDANSTDTIGIVTETIANNQEGFITTSGLVNEINTTGSLQGETWVDGDVIYLSPFTAGAITNIKPTAPNHMVTLGYVVYAHAIHGKIFVKCDNGFEIGELHNVYAPTPSNNDGIFWNTANQRYQNNSIAGVLGFTPISTNIYSGDGSLTGARALTLSGFSLDFIGSSFTNRFTSAGRLLLGTTTEGTNLLDVIGQTRIYPRGALNQSWIFRFSDVYDYFEANGTYATIAHPSSSGFLSIESNGELVISAGVSKVFILGWAASGISSQVIVSNSYTNPTVSTILDVQSTTKGFAPPRMTTTQKLAIASPANGLVVYDTTLNAKCFYDGATWRTDDATIITNRQTASYILALTDRGKLVEMNSASANTLTIPLNSSVAFPVSTKIDITQYGAGATTITAASGVTIRSFTSFLKIAGQYAACTLVKIGTNEWYAYGNLIA